MILGKGSTNSCYSLALPKAIVQCYDLKNTDRLLPEVHLIESPDVMQLKVRIQRNPIQSYSKLRSIPARMVLIKSIVRRMGFTKGIDLICVHTNEPDTFIIAPADPDFKTSIPLSVRFDKNRAPHTDKALTSSQILRKEALDSFLVSNPSENMIRSREQEIIKARSVPVVEDNTDIKLQDLDLPDLSDTLISVPVPVPVPVPANIVTVVSKYRHLVNNPPRWY